jgi:AcrR family transcriptional regulator
MAHQLRSQVTRDRILCEARKLFSKLGYEKTTIRAIASAAEINVSMVIRYYNSKEDLFSAAAETILQKGDYQGVSRENLGRAIAERFFERWEGEHAEEALPALLRAAATHEVARQRLIGIITQQYSRPDAMRPMSKETGILIFSLFVGLAFSRHILKHPVFSSMDKKVIVERISRTVQMFIDADLA